MILSDLNQARIILQIFSLNPNGSAKEDVVSGTVRVYRVSSGTETNVLAETPLARVGTTNAWRYEWVPASIAVGQYVVEYTLNDATLSTRVGEDLIVRDIATQETLQSVQSSISLVQADLEVVKKVETGRWKIEGNQMVFYDTDETTPLLTFNLLDDGGLPSVDRVFERVPV